MAKVFAITNQKGGVGKTTTAVNLAASLTETRRKVLLIDTDPQGNTTMGSGVDKSNLSLTTCDVLLDTAAADEVILQNVAAGHYDLIPANADLTAAEVQLVSALRREYRLHDAMDKARDNYDFILIDCPPSLNMLTVNALVAASGVLIPIQCEYYALEGLTALMETIRQINRWANPNLVIEGILRTMFDPRNNLANDVSQQLLEHFGERVYRTIIPRNVRLAEAPSYGTPVMQYDRNSRGALAYLALAGEILRRLQAETASPSEAPAAKLTESPQS